MIFEILVTVKKKKVHTIFFIRLCIVWILINEKISWFHTNVILYIKNMKL